MGFDSSLDLNTTVLLSRSLSAGLAARSPALKRAIGPDGRVAVPLTISGTPPKVAIVPDMEKLMQLAGRKLLEEQGGKLLNKLFKDRKGGGSALKNFGF